MNKKASKAYINKKARKPIAKMQARQEEKQSNRINTDNQVINNIHK